MTGAATAALVAAALPAAAQDASDFTLFGYQVNASLRAQVGPSYLGSNDYVVGPAGGVSLSKPGVRVFSAPDDSASLTLLGGDTVSAGVLAGLRFGRDNKDDLRGFDKIDWAVEPGAFVNWWIADGLRTRVEVRRGFGGHEGWLATLSADAVHTDDVWTLSAGPRIQFGDAEYTQTYFGVTPRDAARSPFRLPVYTPGGGTTYAGVSASANYQWRPRWQITFDTYYRRMLGDAADSPLVDRLGSPDQFGGSVGLRYVLGR